MNGIGKGCGEGTQARPTDDAYLWLPKVLRDAIGDRFETGSKGQLSDVHGNRRLNLGGELLRSSRVCYQSTRELPSTSPSLPLPFLQILSS